MLRFCSLGSGSSGNATLVEARVGGRVTRVLIDCGFSGRQLARRLERAGTSIAELDAVFVTHEHGDHIGCVALLARRHRIPVHMSEGTARSLHADEVLRSLLCIARDGEPIVIRDLELQPFSVPHDAGEPLQLTCSDGEQRLGVLTDLGCVTPSIVERLQRCNALLLECNHDAQMLADGPYPWFLKRRVGGDRGHLANAQAADVLGRCRHPGLRHVVAAHLSLHNNTPALAAAALAGALATTSREVVVADASQGSPWLDLG